MKKRRLKKWVKITLILIFLAICFITLDALDEKDINNCVNNGHSVEYCKKGIR